MSSDTNTTEVDDDSLVARTVKDITHNLTLVMEGGGGVSGFLILSNRKLLYAKFKWKHENDNQGNAAQFRVSHKYSRYVKINFCHC